MYPHIGEFLDLLHGRGISSYLVTNATFPDAIKTLPPVTQLYTSIDGSTKEELKVYFFLHFLLFNFFLIFFLKNLFRAD